jgi:hypothetical protein
VGFCDGDGVGICVGSACLTKTADVPRLAPATPIDELNILRLTKVELVRVRVRVRVGVRVGHRVWVRVRAKVRVSVGIRIALCF